MNIIIYKELSYKIVSCRFEQPPKKVSFFVNNLAGSLNRQITIYLYNYLLYIINTKDNNIKVWNFVGLSNHLNKYPKKCIYTISP